MTWSIGLHLGESVAEIAARDTSSPSSPLITQRTFLSLGSVGQAFRQFLEAHNIAKIEKIRIATSLPTKIIEAGHGAPAAILTTSGFESWMELTLPLRTRYFSAKAKRVSFLMDRELIFGVSERVNAQGHIEKLLEDSELEFLVAKLELHEIKNVAVGFLHSSKNAENERRAKQYLESRGFRLFLSSSEETIQDEKPRFWSAILNAYVTPLYVEKLKALHDEILKVTDSSTPVTIGDSALSDVIEGRVPPLKTAFTLSDSLASKFARTSPLLYCGLEEFLLFHPHSKLNAAWSSPVGDVAITHSPFVRTRIQPLTKLGRGFFSELTFTRDRISYDPGPIVFGRGLIPSVFDLLAHDESLKSTVGVTEKINDRGTTRLKETFSVYARNASEPKSLDAESFLNHLREMAQTSLKHEIGDNRNLQLCGPLASAVQKWVGGKVMGQDFFAVSSLLMDGVE
jgi:hypothetical protein